MTYGDEEFERLPPNDIEAEGCALGAAMLSPDAAGQVAELLREDDFLRPAHQIIFRALVALYGRGEPVNPVTVHAELPRQADGPEHVPDAPYLHTLIERVPVVNAVASYIDTLRKVSKLRAMAVAGPRIAQLAYTTAAGDADDAADMAQKMLDEATAVSAPSVAKSVADLTMPFMESLEAGGDQRGVASGWTDLGRLVPRFRPGQLITIAARPGVGKSVAMACIAHYVGVRLGLPVFIGTLEMSTDEFMARLVSHDAKVNLKHLLEPELLTDDDWERLARSLDRLQSAKTLVIDDTPAMGIPHVRAALRQMRRTGTPAALTVIDYLQLMESGKKVESRQVEVSQYSRGFKLLAKEFEVPIIVGSQLNRDVERRADKKPILADLRESGCLTGDTTLLRADTGARVPIRDLMTSGWDGVLVWSLDEGRRLVPAPITNVFSTGIKPVFRLTLASGRQVKATANHRFLTYDGWVHLADLAKGTRLAIPRRTPTPTISELGWAEARIGLLAHLIGDGCVLRSQPVHYTSEDEDNLRFVETAAKQEFGIASRRVPQGNWQHVYLPAPHHCTHGRGNPLHAWFRELGIEDRRSHEKRIPDVVFNASDDEVATFLRHLWATDGRIAEPSSMAHGIPTVAYSSTSRELVDGVACLLARFGIIARIRSVAKGHYRPDYRLTVAAAPGMRTFCERIGVHGQRGERAARLLAEIAERKTNTNVDTVPREVWDLVKAERVRVGMTERQFQAAIATPYCGSTLYKSCPSRERLLRCAEALDSEALREAARTDVFWDRVVSIDPLGDEIVYDATVKGTHNFIADGIVAHNSVEQDSDIVIMLNRDDVYDPESPRAGEIDMYVEKNRNGPKGLATLAFQGHYSRIDDMAPRDTWTPHGVVS